MTTPLVRLLDKVIVGDEEHPTCWLFGGSVQTSGYGQLRVDGKLKLAHRLSYELLVGSIPDGLVIDHLCEVRRCIRPKHLEIVTESENQRRRWIPRA